MKICVLVILLTLVGQSQSADKCQIVTGGDWSSAGFALEEKTCDSAGGSCYRPKYTGGAYAAAADGAAWGCTACTTPSACISCSEDNCNVVAPSLTCHTDQEGTTETCGDTEKADTTAAWSLGPYSCVRPKVDADTAQYKTEGVDWGCGVCTTEENCIDACSTDNCNAGATAATTCHGYTKAADDGAMWTKAAKVTCYKETGGSLTGCKMPTPDNSQDAGAFPVCGNVLGEFDATNTKVCDDADCNDIDTAKYCKTGAGNSDKTAAMALPQNFCADAASNCKRPKIDYGAPVASGEAYGCGDCPDESDATCVQCAGSDCNSAWPTTSIKCYTWTKGDDKWTAAAESTDCVHGDGEAKCSKPTDASVLTGYTGTGCGPCAEADTGCTETEADKNNNGQKVVISLLAALLPLLYVLL